MSVGLEIAIEKRSETDHEVAYAYFVRSGRGGLMVAAPTEAPGRVTISKATGDVALREACPDDVHGALFVRVATVLKRHWHAGEYPAVTGWAA